MGVIDLLGRQSRGAVLAVCLALVVVLGVLDHVTGPELDFSIFYLIPISLGAWCVGRDAALGASIASVFTLAVVEQLTPTAYSHPVFAVWNAGLRFGFSGLRMRAMCACLGVRPPFLTLQATQAQQMFSQVLWPPWLRGVTWSRLSSVVGNFLPQY